MGKWLGFAAMAALLGATPAALAAPDGKGTFRVTNDTQRIVECVLLVNGATRTYLKVHPGKSYWDDFVPGRLLQLVCMRGKEGVYGPLKLGVAYRFVEGSPGKVDLAGE
jgi:hypothetical protein